MRLLVVEDEIKTGDYLQQGLTEAGFMVTLARNGAGEVVEGAYLRRQVVGNALQFRDDGAQQHGAGQAKQQHARGDAQVAPERAQVGVGCVQEQHRRQGQGSCWQRR